MPYAKRLSKPDVDYIKLRTLELMAELKSASDQRRAEISEMVVKLNQRLARQVAGRRSRGNPQLFDDYFQAAQLALFRCVTRFDPDKGIEFSTYAVRAMENEITRAFAENRGVRKSKMAKATRVGKIYGELVRTLGRRPTHEEIAQTYNDRFERPIETESVESFLTIAFLEDVTLDGDADPDVLSVIDQLGAEESGFERAERRRLDGEVVALIADVCERFPPIHVEVFVRHYVRDQPYSAIGRELGVNHRTARMWALKISKEVIGSLVTSQEADLLPFGISLSRVDAPV